MFGLAVTLVTYVTIRLMIGEEQAREHEAEPGVAAPAAPGPA